MNFESLGDIFRGLCQSGAWGCFDEFNRISIEVLAAVATQVKTVQDAIVLYSVPQNREEQYQLVAGTPPHKVGDTFMNDVISLIPTCGFYITMNSSYAGRTELPENLKTLFRSCAMIRPDLKPICENMLMSEGFLTARTLAIKFVTLYKLNVELLSPSDTTTGGCARSNPCCVSLALSSVAILTGKRLWCSCGLCATSTRPRSQPTTSPFSCASSTTCSWGCRLTQSKTRPCAKSVACRTRAWLAERRLVRTQGRAIPGASRRASLGVHARPVRLRQDESGRRPWVLEPC